MEVLFGVGDVCLAMGLWKAESGVMLLVWEFAFFCFFAVAACLIF